MPKQKPEKPQKPTVEEQMEADAWRVAKLLHIGQRIKIVGSAKYCSDMRDLIAAHRVAIDKLTFDILEKP
jgi:hypothetical protein